MLNVESKSNNPTYEIALVLAGAVSAGAYTAGVLDFIFEALDSWEKARPGNEVPQHRVVLRVMSGASAGGISAAISAVELQTRYGQQKNGPAGSSLLYEAWVKDIDIKDLLGTKDLVTYGSIKSLFDSTVVDRIADKIIAPEKPKPHTSLPYVSEHLKLYLTLSNLRGLPYSFPLRGETGFPYGMTYHADYQFTEINANTTASDWMKLRNAAVATAAFPVGLSARLIERDLKTYKDMLSSDGRPISKYMDVDLSSNKPYSFVSVDGGMLNNEPIELARAVWTPEPEQPFPNHAIILIDPFPDQSGLGQQATEKDTDLLRIIGPIIGALRSQSLFKLDELLRAGDKDAYESFLIAPIRYTKEGEMAPHAIASGFFGGFGGFFSDKFREHDYWLGRRNAQRFLQKYFALPADVAKVKFGEAAYRQAYAFTDPNDDNRQYYPVIPLINGGPMATENNLRDFPSYEEGDFETLRAEVHHRVKALLHHTLPLGWISRWPGNMVLITTAILIVFVELWWGHLIGSALGKLPSIIGTFYARLFEIVLFLIGFILLVLRLGLFVLRRRVVKKFVDYIRSQMTEWGLFEQGTSSSEQ